MTKVETCHRTAARVREVHGRCSGWCQQESAGTAPVLRKIASQFHSALAHVAVLDTCTKFQKGILCNTAASSFGRRASRDAAKACTAHGSFEVFDYSA